MVTLSQISSESCWVEQCRRFNCQATKQILPRVLITNSVSLDYKFKRDHDKNSNIQKTTSRGRIFRWWIESLLMVGIRWGWGFSEVFSEFRINFPMNLRHEIPWDDAGRFSENWRLQWIKWIKSKINFRSENDKVTLMMDMADSKLELIHQVWVDTRYIKE